MMCAVLDRIATCHACHSMMVSSRITKWLELRLVLVCGTVTSRLVVQLLRCYRVGLDIAITLVNLDIYWAGLFSSWWTASHKVFMQKDNFFVAQLDFLERQMLALPRQASLGYFLRVVHKLLFLYNLGLIKVRRLFSRRICRFLDSGCYFWRHQIEMGCSWNRLWRNGEMCRLILLSVCWSLHHFILLVS